MIKVISATDNGFCINALVEYNGALYTARQQTIPCSGGPHTHYVYMQPFKRDLLMFYVPPEQMKAGNVLFVEPEVSPYPKF